MISLSIPSNLRQTHCKLLMPLSNVKKFIHREMAKISRQLWPKVLWQKGNAR